jgi:hypothetical protein
MPGLRRLKATHSIINFILLNAAFGSPPSEDLTGQAIINRQSKKPADSNNFGFLRKGDSRRKKIGR